MDGSSPSISPPPFSHIYPNHGALTAYSKVHPPEEPRLKDVEITATTCLIHLPHGPRSRRSVSRSAISERGGVAVEINDAAIQSRPAESGTAVPTAVMLSLRMPDWSVVYTGQRAFRSKMLVTETQRCTAIPSLPAPTPFENSAMLRVIA